MCIRDSYESAELASLKHAVSQSSELAKVLTANDGCRLPKSNVSIVGDAGGTSRRQLVDAMAAFSSTCQHQDLAILYFAGHGISGPDSFSLAVSETDVCDEDTALSSLVLAQQLADCRARGILLLVDCCGGAGIAENSPEFLSTLGSQRDFRIVLSASAIDEAAWEFTDRGSLFCQVLIEALGGKMTNIGAHGEIYFQELFDHVRRRMESEQASLTNNQYLQKPVFLGYYSRNPLLFVNVDITLSSIELRTARYSALELRRRIVLTASLSVSVIVLTLASYWSWMDQYRYIKTDDSKVVFYHGYPGLSGFGLPKLIYEHDVSVELIRSNSDLRNSEAVVFPKRRSADSALRDELTGLGHAMLAYSEQNFPESARLSGEFAQNDQNNESDRILAWLLFSASAGKTHIGLLEDLTQHGNSDVSLAALLALARLQRERALVIAENKGFQHFGLQMDLMRTIAEPCDEALLRYLERFTSYNGATQFHKFILDTYMRAECKVPADALDLDSFQYFETMARTHWLYGEISNDEFVTRLLETASSKVVNGVHPAVSQLYALLGLPCLESDLTELPVQGVHKTTLLKLVVILSRDCSNISVDARINLDEAEIVIAAKEKTTGEFLISSRHSARASVGEMLIIIESLDFARQDQAIGILEAILSETASDTVTGYVLSILTDYGEVSMNSSNYLESNDDKLRYEGLRSMLISDRPSGIDELVLRMTDSKFDFIPALLQEVILTTQERAQILHSINDTAVNTGRSALVRAVIGDQAGLLGMLNSPLLSDRQAAYDALGAFEDLNALEAGIVVHRGRVNRTQLFLTGSRSARELFRLQLQSVPDWAMGWRADLLLSYQLGTLGFVGGNSVLSSGDRLYLRRLLREMGGDPSDVDMHFF